jgi:carboxylesterase type B
MSAYWANFAKSGDPNGPGLPFWQPYTKEQRVQLDFNVGRIETIPISPKAEIVTKDNFQYPELLL